MEAMTMELPTIATNWSGNTEFMNDRNSFLIAVDSMVEANKDKHLWAKPSVEHLGKLMRYVHDNPKEAKARGKQGRKDVVARYSHEKVGERIVQLLEDIRVNRLEEGRKYNEGRAGADEPSTNWLNDWDTWASIGGIPSDQSEYKLSELPSGWSRIKIIEDNN